MTFIPKSTSVQNIPTLRYGMNNQQEADEILDYELSDCENISIDEDSMKSAEGYVQFGNESEGTYWGIYQFKKSDGTQRLIRQRGSILEYDSNGSGDWQPCTLPTTGSPATPISLTEIAPTWATLNDIVLYSNGTDYVMSSSDGITWVQRTGLPKSRVIMNNNKNRILFMAQPAAYSRVDWCDINDPLTINASSYQLIDPNNGEVLIGGAVAPDGTNLVFKENSVYQISDYTTDGMIDVNKIGSVRLSSHHSIANTEDSVMFMGQDGIYEYKMGGIYKISGKINMLGRNAITNKSLCCGAYIESKYHLSIPDSDISQTYNSQEYIVYKKQVRNDSTQPYAITRNRRYFGCYAIEDYDIAGGGKRVRLYAGDSRPSTSGSPAESNTLFCYINVYRDTTITQGLNGEPQECWFITKFYTGKVPYYVKKFKKFFFNLKLDNDTTVVVGYRFSPYQEFTEVSQSATGGDIDFVYDDLTTGGFGDGFGFSSTTSSDQFIDIENEENPRGIQFRIRTNQVNDATVLGLAFSYRVKQRFK